VTTIDTPTTVSPSFGVNINIQAPNNIQSPWGPAFKIYSCEQPTCGKATDAQKINNLVNKHLLKPLLSSQGIQEVPNPGITLYCVSCGMTGNVNVGGSLSFRLIEGVSAATISVNGDLKASLGLALDAYASYSATLASQRVSAIGLPGFSIPNIITIGPELTLDMTATVSVSADGQLYAGGSLNMPSFSANVDFIHNSNSHSSGWTPQYTWNIGAYGTITAEATLGIPFGLALGVDILEGKFSLQAAIVDTPELNAVMSYTGSIDIGSDTCSTSVVPTACQGVAWSIALANSVDLQFLNTYE
jgi:hypothetical protein